MRDHVGDANHFWSEISPLAFRAAIPTLNGLDGGKILSNDTAHRTKVTPGTWSTDEYIRRWARNHGMVSGECIIPLQSLHDQWVARIDFDKQGEPVERMTANEQELCPA